MTESHIFTSEIKKILSETFNDRSDLVFQSSPILQYLNIKTKSAVSGSKSRGSFGNIYAIYVILEDYINKGYDKNKDYKNYGGAKFSDLFRRQRELPFGRKLQNHALNHRLNEEFKRYFPTCNYLPVTRDVETNRYWFNENLIIAHIDKDKYNLAKVILKIIDKYMETKQESFQKFIKTCEDISKLEKSDKTTAVKFIQSLIAPNMDARIFEIVSYCILKYYFYDQKVYFGFELDDIKQEKLRLYKTGRTNANDGGIDFVMKPLGRFFQVTETIDVHKYFLDIDKIEHYPITFVVKLEDDINEISEMIKNKAEEIYSVNKIVGKYMKSIEEIINIPILLDYFDNTIKKGRLNDIIHEIILQSKVEFNYEEE